MGKKGNLFWGHIRVVAVLLGAVLVFALVNSAVTPAPDEFAYMRKARAIETSRFGVSSPVGLAFSPDANALLLVEEPKTGVLPFGRCDIVMVGLGRQPLGTLTVAADIRDPLNITFSPRANSLMVLDKAANQLIKINADSEGRPDPSEKAVTRYDAGRFAVQNPQGITSDPETGDLYILDASGPRIVRLSPGPGQDFSRAMVEWMPAPAIMAGGPFGAGRIAFNPENRHLYLLSPADRKLFEIMATGEVVSLRDLSSLRLAGPQAMLFAPSGDQTDDPSIMGLYIANTGFSIVQEQNRGEVIELSLTAPVLSESVLAAGTVPGSLVNTVYTSLWSPPSPDPTAIDYYPASGTYWICDSEVEEMPGLWAGVNLFEMAPSGSLVSTHSTTSFSREPTGIAHNPSNGHLFISDDDWQRIFEVDLGPDGLFGTADDAVRFFGTASYGSTDPEGVAYDSVNKILFITDGVNAEVYLITPGTNGIFDGAPPAGDDQFTQFDTTGMGLTDGEAIEFNPDSRTLYLAGPSKNAILEVALDGTLVMTINISDVAPQAPGGLAYGPGSADPNVKSIFLAERGLDNNPFPDENDGRILEFAINWPIIYSFNPTSGPAGTLVTLTGKNFTGATVVTFKGQPAVFNVVSDSSITATVPAGATTGKINVTTPVSTGSSLTDFIVTFPPTITSFNPTSGPVGTVVTVTGTYFTGATAVKFNGVSASFTVISNNSLTATVPAGATTGKISVTTPSGTATSSSDYRVTTPPIITSFNPTSGRAGTFITLTGKYFTGTTAVKFNGISTSFLVASDTSLTAMVPAGATSGKISATSPEGTGTSSTDFIVIAPPVITSFNPTSGPVGTEVTVIGSYFTGTYRVAFNGLSAAFSVTSDTVIKATVPMSATTGNITVNTPEGVATSSGIFTVTVAPLVASIMPNIMRQGTSIQVMVNGRNFVRGATLTFENGAGPVPRASSVVVMNSREINARITVSMGRLSRNSLWDVVVTNPDGSRGVLARGFTVTP